MTQNVGDADLPYLLYDGHGQNLDPPACNRILALAMAPGCQRAIPIIQISSPPTSAIIGKQILKRAVSTG